MLKRIKLYFKSLASIIRINKGLIVGMWKLTKLPQPAITVFGGTKLSKDHPSSKIIVELAKKLAHEGFSIITGGGPGVMEAANLGASKHIKEHSGKELATVGIGLAKLQPFNEYVRYNIVQPYFFTRKWLLVRYSVGFVVGPGGFGTLDELAEVLTLIQTHRMPKTPIVLIGKDYWQPLMDWVYNSALKEELLTKADATLISIADNADDAFKVIQSKCTGFTQCGVEASPTEKK